MIEAVSKCSMMVFTILHNEIYRQYLQQQEEKEIKVPPNEEKNI